jgi:hypothetical protein
MLVEWGQDMVLMGRKRRGVVFECVYNMSFGFLVLCWTATCEGARKPGLKRVRLFLSIELLIVVGCWIPSKSFVLPPVRSCLSLEAVQITCHALCTVSCRLCIRRDDYQFLRPAWQSLEPA